MTADATHSAASYFLVVLACGSDWDGGRAAVLLATILCAVGAGGAGLVAIILAGIAPLFVPMCS